jgi:thymidylate synthase (FAD)
MPQYVTPTVHVVGSMFVDREALIAFLVEIDDELGDWVRRRQNVDDLSLLTEAMGRLCYRSWAPGLNPNVQHIRGDTSSYIENLLFQQHGSVFEHASISFILRNVPRVLTHELVRHRVGVAVSQESMRYVRLTDIPFYMPKIFLQPFPNDEDGEMAENFQKLDDGSWV